MKKNKNVFDEAADAEASAAPIEPTPLTDEQVDAEIRELAKLTPIEYERRRKEAAKRMGISRLPVLDTAVDGYRERKEQAAGMIFQDIEPHTDTVNGAELLDMITATTKRFIACDDETIHAAALWITATWFIDAVSIAPIALITSPDKRCGKTQLQTVIKKLVFRELSASSISPSAIYRTIEKWQPTLLLDEADAFLKDSEELRGIINSGHSRENAYVIRTVEINKEFEPARFGTFGFKCLAGIGSLADTIMDRSVVLKMRRKKADEIVDRLRHADPEIFTDIARKLARFAEDNLETVRNARPRFPVSLNDRASDNWESLLAIADTAGGEWSRLAREAAVKLSGDDDDSVSIQAELLFDIRSVFEEKSAQKITSKELLTALNEIGEAPWSTYNRGKPMSGRQLAKRLSGYGIKSKNIRFGLTVTKGYDIDEFQEAFSIYLLTTPEISATPLQIA